MRRLVYSLFALTLLLAISHAESGSTDFIVTLRNAKSIAGVNEAAGTKTVRSVKNAPVFLVRSDTSDGAKALKKLQKHPDVKSVEPDVRIRLTSANSQPSWLRSSYSDLLDGGSRTTFFGTDVLRAYAEQPALDVTGVSAVRSLSTGIAARVAYIDTGVDRDHPALRAWLDPGVDLVRGSDVSELDGLGSSYSDLLDHSYSDLLDKRLFFFLNSNAGAGSGLPAAFGHGTMVAGLIHAVAPQSVIIPIKAFDAYGDTTMFRIIEGVYQAIQLNADVLNMSFSTEEQSDALLQAIDAARAAGVAVVAAVGNESKEFSNRYPASYNGVYGVAATDLNDKLANFSNYGRDVSLTAPGVGVISTAPGGRYAAAWGTSFSSPIVAGSIALMVTGRSHNQSYAAAVLNTSQDIDGKNPGFERKLGKGRINLRNAFKAKD